MAVDQGHDMWVLKAHEDIDLGRKVFLELFIELRQVHGLDSYIGFRFLCGRTRLAFITPHITKKGHDSLYEHPDRPSQNYLARSHRAAYSDRRTFLDGRARVISSNVVTP